MNEKKISILKEMLHSMKEGFLGCSGFNIEQTDTFQEAIENLTSPSADTTIPPKKATSKSCHRCNDEMTEEEFKIQAGYCDECINKMILGKTS